MSHLHGKPGDRIAEYVLLDKIGVGPMGEVWKARLAEKPFTVVALKIAADPERFRDARSMGTQPLGLDHPAVVRTLGLNIAHDPPYVVMEYVEGRSLRQVLEKGRRLTPGDALETAIQVLEVLGCAHEQGVIHGNLKPENLLIETPPGAAAGSFRVRVTDFGPGMVARTGALPATGDLSYLSPENRQGEMFGVRSDLYAVGAMLFEMLTGRTPAGEESPSEAAEGVPALLDGVVRKALHARPEGRYATARQMREDVLACLRAVRSEEARADKHAAGASGSGKAEDSGPRFREQVRRVVDDVKGRQSVDVGRAFNDAIAMLSRSAGTLLLAGLISGLLSLATAFILAGPLTAGLYAMVLRVLRGGTVEVGDVFGSFDRFWSKMFAFYVILFGILVGFVHLVLPGIVIAGLTMYVFPILAERKVGFGQAFSESAGLVWKHGLLVHSALVLVVILMDVSAGWVFPGGLLASWLLSPFLYGLIGSAYLQVQERESAAPEPNVPVAAVPATA